MKNPVCHLALILLILTQLNSYAQKKITVVVKSKEGANIKTDLNSWLDTTGNYNQPAINEPVVLLKSINPQEIRRKRNSIEIGRTDSSGILSKELTKKEMQYSFLTVGRIGGSTDTIKISSIESDTAHLRLKVRPIYVAKPAIYLYPTQKTTVHIRHDFKGKIGTTYPAYKSGWKVIAEPDGALLNLADNRKYEYLFWDGTYTFSATHFNYKEGFVVAKENTTDFLWKQLAHIGLNEKEINDFVVYWLPQLERNQHNFIYFHINNDIDHSSVLTVQPQPDSWIRVFMEFKSVPANYSIAEQQLPTIKRNGFTLVEWGGAVIGNSVADFE